MQMQMKNISLCYDTMYYHTNLGKNYFNEILCTISGSSDYANFFLTPLSFTLPDYTLTLIYLNILYS